MDHYLSRLVDFIYAELDRGSSTDRRAVIIMAVDLAMIFNCLDHSKLVTIMFDIGVPPCALRLVVSYLQGRCMEVHIKDAVSLVFDLWGAAPREDY